MHGSYKRSIEDTLEYISTSQVTDIITNPIKYHFYLLCYCPFICQFLINSPLINSYDQGQHLQF